MAQTQYALDFERPLIALESKIAELKSLSESSAAVDFHEEIAKLEKKARRLQQEIFSDLSRWQVVQLSRHPSRPYTLDYVNALFTDFVELEGDRRFAADRAIVAGFARFEGESVLVMGHQKGRSTKENMLRNFGMPRPEGYRKAARLFELASRLRKPIITFIDTAGAYPGLGAEERGQAEAIASALELMSGLEVPVVAVVIGEGGSGGALGIGVANRILMLEYAWYCVISPESCSAILFRDASRAEKTAEALRLTARDLESFGIIDAVVPEAAGGAHRDPKVTFENVRRALKKQLAELSGMTPEELVRDRYQKFRAIGVFGEEE